MDIHDMIGTGTNNIGTQVVFLILVVGPVEEIIFRGYIYHILKEMTNKWVAGVLSSLLFGAWHLVNGNIFQGIITSLIGFVFVLNLILNKKANLWSVVIAHGVYDAMLLILATIL
jgi:membrane protease YdiL (CAAX protease family)